MTIIFQGTPGAIALSQFLLSTPIGIGIVIFSVLLAAIFGGFMAYYSVTDGNLGY